MISLSVLTMLGLTLAATTASELQVATNYRWSQQAFYNAEGGVEVARATLRTASWGTVLPPARAAAWPPVPPTLTPPEAPFDRAHRNFENGACDIRGNGAGFGVVLDEGGSGNEPYEDVTWIYGQALNGAVTLWIRRPLVAYANGWSADATGSDRLILTAEGAAPAPNPGLQRPASVRVIEATIERHFVGPYWDVSLVELRLGSAVCH